MTPTSEMSPSNKAKKRVISLGWLIPNLMTVTALSFGLTGLRFAFAEKWVEMLAMLVLAILFDILDGRLARLFKSTSQFGAQLDSLSDAVVFGVVPAIGLYLWGLQPASKIAWAATLFFCICGALRLARFNSELQDDGEHSRVFFTGVPMPASAFLAMMPLVAYLEFSHEFFRDWKVISAWMVLVGIGTISTMPTYSGKGLRLPRHAAIPLLSSFALITAAIFVKPWFVWTILGLVYVAHIPVVFIISKRKTRRDKN